MELAVCRQYYLNADPSRVDDHGDVAEGLCKLNVIQMHLVMLRAWLSLLTGLIGTLVALPFGILADTRGRKMVLGLTCLVVSFLKCGLFWFLRAPQSLLSILAI